MQTPYSHDPVTAPLSDITSCHSAPCLFHSSLLPILPTHQAHVHPQPFALAIPSAGKALSLSIFARLPLLHSLVGWSVTASEWASLTTL